MITWGDVVGIIACVFDINQTQLAKLMKCDKAAITRIKSGIQTPSFSAEQLFALIFDPDTSDSPASKGRRTPQYWLDLVKEEIESDFKEVRKAMEDYWNENDYRTFVLVLLERTGQGSPSKKQQRLYNDSRGLPAESDVIINVSTDDFPPEADTSHPSEDYLPVGRQPEARHPPQQERVSEQFADVMSGAQIHIEDKYKCCRFCVRWMGDMSDEIAGCKTFKDQREAIDGRGCKYYKPNEGRMAVNLIRCHRPLKNQD